MANMKDNIKLFVKYLMRFFLKIYWIFPIRKKTVFFMANMGKGFLCNPKYIYLSLKDDQRFNDYNYIWCFSDPSKQDPQQFSKNTLLIRKNNYLKYFYYLLTSEVIIYNCGGFSYAPVRKKQYLIETGHGGGLQKKNGFMVESKSSSSNKGIKLADKDIKLWLASDEMHAKIYIRKAMGYDGIILKSGYPRSDIFFKDNSILKKEVRSRLGIDDSTHIVLYAPTFKGSEDHASSISDGSEIIDAKMVKNLLSRRFGGEWLFCIRGHLYSQEIHLQNIDKDLTSYSDMQEILLVTDILITDYSSCVWDFFLLGRPSFLYVPDRDYYEKQDRGFYIALEEWPGIIVNSNTCWEDAIMNYNEMEYKNKLETYRNRMKPYEHGKACEIVKNYIYEVTRR